MNFTDNKVLSRILGFNQFTRVQDIRPRKVSGLYRMDPTGVEVRNRNGTPSEVLIRVVGGEFMRFDLSSVLYFGYEKDLFTVAIHEDSETEPRKLRFSQAFAG